ncbi:xanthine dehydrogenase family protein molybdopterin-binding subunit [Ideonella sp. BN130291]|uniref:xanthine dehydrogenase family protein molybdopterin-binding subunit n=1 Tax=Ideonella sp. BN130291 TaxID=3112940 RepID=UPI002E26B8FA|nr:xanthine dehydrogenase family protein molybdopterin-binding subunit [Ideonella sp. BN130291]
MSRRRFLLSAAAIGGALLVGWGVMPARSRLGQGALLPSVDGDVPLNGWIKIAPDGGVLLAMNRSEMGQGVHTALAMLVAEELDVPLGRVTLVEPGHDAIYGNVAMFVGSLPFHPVDSQPGQESSTVRSGRWIVSKVARELGINATGGSSSIADGWEPLRQAAATARGQLLGAASLQWRLPVDELVVTEGVVSHPSGPKAHYGELAKVAASTPPGNMQPKDPKAWKLIGRPAPRIDVVAKSSGRAGFGIDVRLPGMLFAAIRHSPAIGGGIGAVDVNAVLQQPGVERVVRLGPYAGSTAAVAVVARTSWHARRAAQAMQAEGTARPAGALDSQAILVSLEKSAREAAAHGGGFGFHGRGDAAQALAGAAKKLEVVYRAPYLAHAAMEPINCTARVADGKVELWAPTQVPGMARNLAASVAGVPVDDVTVHVTYLGGGFGRRLDVDFVGQAVRIAMDTNGRPVQLLWSREEDMTHDFYRPAGVAVMQAGLDAQGNPVALAITSAGDAITPRWLERGLPALSGPMDAPDKTTSEGLFDQPYGVPNQRIGHVATTHGVPVGFWRSVGHSHNAFFGESFIDELAAAAGQDPYAFRLGLLKDMPRHAAVLKLAADQAGWRTPLPPGRARGIALHESFDTIVAQVAEVSLEGGKPRVHRVVCAVDCGVVVNPDIVAQQMESGVIFGLSAALHQRIDIVDGVVKQKNFPDYPLVTLKDAPAIETHIVPSTRHPSGMGEPGTPPIAPAVGNALFVLTGKRLRELPFVL